MTPIDSPARTRALETRRSFIVQAPAGSGKTGLLTQRVLALLAEVRQPEEVVAITFTRKAATEMKARVLHSLELTCQEPPTKDFELKTWQLAKAVLHRDHQYQWRLRENPNRLHIMTIDALCHAIVRQLPILTELGSKATLTDHPKTLYQRAARETLDVFDDDVPWKWAVLRLFKHLDNDWARIESMLAELLERRDQWLRHVGQEADTSLLENLNVCLATMVQLELETIHPQIPKSLWPEIVEVMAFSRSLLPDPLTKEFNSPWIGRSQPPGTHFSDVTLWQELAHTLLTQDGLFRKTWNITTGFPPKTNAKTKDESIRFETMKNQTKYIVEKLGHVENFEKILGRVRQLPAEPYSQQQWLILEALLTLLKVAAGNLVVLFATQEVVDHVEVARRAIMALGATDNPSDLALRLDHRIRHLLVDEFQDTSRLQYELLERLVAGWDPHEGNTLFLVGDPMQSIYRFREADVGLFLRVQKQGIGPVTTLPLALEVNFRSLPGIVSWVNTRMNTAFPKEQRPETGAVSFKISQSSQADDGKEAVEIHPCEDRISEARKIVELVRVARENDQSVCILVRTRSHLAEILPALDEQGLRYQAVELQPLAQLTIVQDLLALTRAMIHPGDRIAWLAVLRAPWCGLSLPDLHAIANLDPKATIRDCMNHKEIDQHLSPTGQTILNRVRPILNQAYTQRGTWSPFPGSGTLRRWIEGTWRQLGAPATLPGERFLSDTKSFFDLLESLETRGEPLDPETLREEVSNLYSNIDPLADPKLTVMTIHKAKGLEFDCVILPGLDRRPRPDDQRLLLWTDPPVSEEKRHETNLAPLLAPIGSGDKTAADPIYRFVQSIDQEKSRNEVCRLLYVAVTRAKENLHLLGLSLKKSANPAPGSFLAALWPVLSPYFATKEDKKNLDEQEAEPPFTPPVFRRLHQDWCLPPPPPQAYPTPPPNLNLEEPIIFDWVGTTSRRLGIVIHRFLALMAAEGAEKWPPQRIIHMKPTFVSHLIDQGLSKEAIPDTLDLLIKALTTVINSETGRWIVAHHNEARSEWGLTGIIKNRTISITIDRSFIDQDGTRWIIDYKTSQHEGGDREGFLKNEKLRYQSQLDLYSQLLFAMEGRPIRLGLYFPLMDAWMEWPWQGQDNTE